VITPRIKDSNEQHRRSISQAPDWDKVQKVRLNSCEGVSYCERVRWQTDRTWQENQLWSNRLRRSKSTVTIGSVRPTLAGPSDQGRRQQPGLHGPASGGGQADASGSEGPPTRPAETLISFSSCGEPQCEHLGISFRPTSNSICFSQSSQTNSKIGINSSFRTTKAITWADHPEDWTALRPAEENRESPLSPT